MANWTWLGVATIAGFAGAQDQPRQPQPEQPAPSKTPTDASPGAANDQPLVGFPHPLISEVLFNVPRGAEGDANADGKRESNGDEFVELVNPHARAISLKGYSLLDAKGVAEVSKRRAEKEAKPGEDQGTRSRRDRSASDVVFEFPDLTLKPGEVVVVFNGRGSTFKGPVGDSGRAAGANENFGGAYVLTMRVASKFMGLNNQHDCVVLRSPTGENVQVVTWGEPGAAPEDPGEDRAGGRRSDAGPAGEPKPGAPAGKPPAIPTGTRHDKVLDTPRGSVQRTGVTGEFADHASLEGGHLFSPGVFPGTVVPPPASPAEGEPKPAGRARSR